MISLVKRGQSPRSTDRRNSLRISLAGNSFYYNEVKPTNVEIFTCVLAVSCSRRGIAGFFSKILMSDGWFGWMSTAGIMTDTLRNIWIAKDPLEHTFGISSVVLFLVFLHFSKGIRLFTQGVLKIRKRVTLMVVTVSAIFGISWGTHSILHVLDDIGSYKLNPFAIPISHVMLMLNAAVNPFAYALINQRFREKINRLIFCYSSRVHVAR